MPPTSLGTCILTSVLDPERTCIWASWIQIRNYFVQTWILPSTSKKINKILDFCCLVTSLWLFIFVNVNVPTESNNQNKLEKYLFFCWHLIRKSSVRVQGSGPMPKCHGSGTLDWKLLLIQLITLMRIRMRIRILLITSMRIGVRIRILLYLSIWCGSTTLACLCPQLASTIFCLCFRTGRGGVRAVLSADDGSVATSSPARGASKENTRPSKTADTEGTRSTTAAAAKKKNTKKATRGRGSESGATEPALGRVLSR